MLIIVTVALLTIGVLYAIAAFVAFRESETIHCIMFSLVATVSIVAACCVALPETEQLHENNMIERKEQIEKDKIPRVISEVDGCKVYAFSDGSKWHYFTRCENSHTFTDTTQKKCKLVGKVNSCKEYFTSIETTTNK